MITESKPGSPSSSNNSPPPTHPYSISRIHSNSHSTRTSTPMPISLTTNNSSPNGHNLSMHNTLNHNDGSRSPTNYIQQGYGSPTGWLTASISRFLLLLQLTNLALRSQKALFLSQDEGAALDSRASFVGTLQAESTTGFWRATGAVGSSNEAFAEN